MNALVSRAARRLAPALRIAALLGAGSALAAQNVGRVGPLITGSGPTVGLPAPTENKPENKLWHNDGKWWGGLWSATGLAYTIHRLDPVTHQWIDTGVVIDSRRDSRCDALSTPSKLYVATHENSAGPGSPGDLAYLMRYTYAAGGYTLDAGFPAVIADCATESMTIERDSTGRLYAAWKQALRVYYAYTTGDDAVWSAATLLPRCLTDFTSDDICGLVRFGSKLGVMWNDQVVDKFYFAWRNDASAPTWWEPLEIALDGESDDHINLSADSTGRVFAVVKNQHDEIKLLVRAAGGGWSQYLVSEAKAKLTRPIVVLDENARLIHVYATVEGTIVEKTSPLDAIAFQPGAGTVVIRHDGAIVNNPTSTKQNVTAYTGIVVLASNLSQAGNYWFHEVAAVPRELSLAQPLPGTAGTVNTFQVTGCVPRANINFLASVRIGNRILARAGCPLGIPVLIGTPVVNLGTARANAMGVATLNVPMPLSLAGRTYHIQAIQVATCGASNRVTEQF